MKINELKNLILNVIDSKEHIPMMIWSGPGIGKSSLIKQIAKEEGLKFIDLRLSLLNPVDLRGLPIVDREKGIASWVSPEFLPHDKKSSGILFLDEVNLAPFSVMAAGYQLILDRRIGEYSLPDGWKVIAAGNRAEDNSNVTKFPAPLANRFVHVELEPDEEEWRTWALKSNISEQIVAFLGKFPQHLYKFPKAGEHRFPTPRSWEYASKLFSSGLPIGSAVGDGVAAEFEAFIRVYKDLPDIEAILSGTSLEVPKKEQVDVLWALCMALVTRSKEENIGNIIKYIDNISEEFQVITIVGIVKKNNDMKYALLKTKEWKDWEKNHKELIKALESF